jgi:hypothetical protein
MIRFVDVRLPAGALVAVLGFLLAAYGLARPAADPPRVNLWWGAVMFVFGIGLLGLARRARRRSS